MCRGQRGQNLIFILIGTNAFLSVPWGMEMLEIILAEVKTFVQ